MSNKYFVSIDDNKYYESALQHLIEENLNKAWSCINKINSYHLKNSIIKFSMRESFNIKDRVMYDTFYKGCDGNWHSSPDSPRGSTGNGGGGDGCCSAVCCVVMSVCCSVSIKECCFCAVCDIIKDIHDFCS